MPALQALCLRVALVSEMLDTEGVETVCGGTCNWVHKGFDMARLRERGLVAVAHARGHVPSDAVVAHRTEERAPHVGLNRHPVVGVTRIAGG